MGEIVIRGSHRVKIKTNLENQSSLKLDWVEHLEPKFSEGEAKCWENAGVIISNKKKKIKKCLRAFINNSDIYKIKQQPAYYQNKNNILPKNSF